MSAGNRSAHDLRALSAAALTVAALAFGSVLPVAASADGGCDRFASPSGSDAATGTAAEPVRSIARLIAITGAGEEGCLPAGSTFTEPIGSFIVDGTGGEPGRPAVIRTDDQGGEPAIVHGAMWLKGGAHDLTFERIRFIGSPGNDDKGTMLVVDGDRITFRDTEMTWPRGICLNAGHRDGYEAGDQPDTVAAEGLVIETSRIHDCGNDPEIIASLRAGGQSGVHGLYLVYAPGARIRDNYIYDNVSRGLQLWPDVDGAIVEHNVFDGNGSNINVGSSADHGHFSEGNRFADNIVTDAVLRSDYDPPWGPGDTESIVGNFPDDGNTRDNVFEGNCVYQANPSQAYGGFGFVHTADVFEEPRYVDAPDKDFRLADGSPCAGKGPRSEPLPLPGSPETPPPPRQRPAETRPPAGTKLLLRFAKRPSGRRGGRSIDFELTASEAAEATIGIRWTGRDGTARLGRRHVELRAGGNPVRLRLGGQLGDPARCRVTIVATAADGSRAGLRTRASGA